ncbi:DUF559 domain-containing protein [Verminephrobacter aporrectodeae subsp. tuberculatae]|uniref:AAA domain-containing protein n=1 Tax=Verminephrobacter aporrectodeae TaxID=1110389 RepID=UPI002244DBAC|nr:AAA domain-containing protein [Verminephrobacter aporrectodeae]MCW8209229.1 DUF559 domain-containing protein [Verminephrobacter aporrectodeae subsp. tuberculatae]
MNSQAARVIDLLTYIEEVEKLKRKPVYVVPSDFFASHQAELATLPELQLNMLESNGEVWLRIPRMQEIPAPVMPPKLMPWVTISKIHDKPPVLNGTRQIMKEDVNASPEQLENHPDIPPLFDWYLSFQWMPWRTAEKTRRKTIALYNRLFSLSRMLSTDGVENSMELVWGLGMASWEKPGSASKVEHPLITQACELRLNEKTFALEISPRRQVNAKMELDCYVDMGLGAVTVLENVWKEIQQSEQASPVNPFLPDTFEEVLKTAVAQLDSTGRYESYSGDYSLPTPGANLVVSRAWVVFARKRSVDIFLEDVRRLKSALEGGAEVPAVIKEFVTEGDSVVRAPPEVAFRGLSSSASGQDVRDLYFPMPYNDEQVSIASKLENNSGVVVQGPPGTGKTHTIANIICHFLAQGKRVLVTSKGDTALSVLQEKLPERIRALSVGLLSNERDGMRQFEHSIAKIATEVSGIQPGEIQAKITACEEQLNELHARISAVDHAINQDASENMQKYQIHGKEFTPGELAKLVMEQMDDHQWFEDVPPAGTADNPPISETDVQLLRHARAQCKTDLHCVGVTLPALSALPTWEILSDLHRDIIRAKTIEKDVETGEIFPLKDSSVETFAAASALSPTLTKYIDALRSVKAHPLGANLLPRLRKMPQDDVLIMELIEFNKRFRKLDDERKRFVAKAIDAPVDSEKNPDFLDALGRLEEGKSAFAFPFGKGDARKQIHEITVAGVKPADAAQWKLVRSAMEWRLAANQELARYGAIGVEFGLDSVSRQDLYAGVRSAAKQLGIVEAAHDVVFGVECGLFAGIERVFGARVATHLDGDREEASLLAVVDSLDSHLEKGRLGYAMGKVAEYAGLVNRAHGVFPCQLGNFLQERLGSPSEDDAILRTDWMSLLDELKRLTVLKPQLDIIETTCNVLRTGGAPVWAAKLRTVAPTSDFDPHLPTNWRDAWMWRIAHSLLERIDVHFKLRSRFDERRKLTAQLAKTYQDLVADRAWLGVYNNSPASIRQALQEYLTAIRAIGAGTGVRAERHRRNAQAAMQRAHAAVPCWILPQWRVSETMPATLGLFDLVIVDEASQSDIWAFPALLRGRKLLVVGDHKQVSPSVVGMTEKGFVDLGARCLKSQPHGSNMTPDKSIYDLACVVFAGNSVMLKEHFRCVSPIIEYSNREFYNGEIRPLRVPKSTERLDPPLIDVFVKGGQRKGDRNPLEAKAIVDEIMAILADDSLAGRTIGVVTLVGIDQAKLIHELITREIPPEAVIDRKITVGPPPSFQGRERDIMMVSTVLQPGDRSAANSLGQQQRFNVALSRARDRTYLFRSVEDGAFPPDSLTGRLLRHFRQPFMQDPKVTSVARDLCESGFERDMFDALTRPGFRVRPQVPCGGFRIDFVVEGSDGRRLAVECDGDRFHGPGQWSADMARQRVLERAGWVFWRCFASSFVRRRQEVLGDLFGTLHQLGIEPLGDTPQDNSVWVMSRTVDLQGLDAADEITEESV